MFESLENENVVKLYLGKTDNSSASIIANLLDIK